MVFAPVAGQRCGTVDEFAALEEVAEGVHAVVVQRVAVERRLAVLQYDVVAGTCHLVVTVVVGVVAGQSQRVALYHLHVSPCLEGVALLVEVGAVAVEVSPHVTEVHVAVQHLCVAVDPLVVVQVVRVDQIDLLVLRLALTRRTLFGWLGGKDAQHQHAQHGNDTAFLTSHFSFLI